MASIKVMNELYPHDSSCGLKTHMKFWLNVWWIVFLFDTAECIAPTRAFLSLIECRIKVNMKIM